MVHLHPARGGRDGPERDPVGQSAARSDAGPNGNSATSSRKFYSQDLLNILFRHPYTKIGLVETELGVSRVTASKYLGLLAKRGFVRKQRMGRTNFFINDPVFALLRDLTVESR